MIQRVNFLSIFLNVYFFFYFIFFNQIFWIMHPLIIKYEIIKVLDNNKIYYIDDHYISKFIQEYSHQNNNDYDIFPEAINQDSIYNSIKLLRLKNILSKENFCIIDINKANLFLETLKLYLKIESLEQT